MTSAQGEERFLTRTGGILSWAFLCILFLTTLTAPIWIPIVMGGVPAKPTLLASLPRQYVLSSPWDRIAYKIDETAPSAPTDSLTRRVPVAVDDQAVGFQPAFPGISPDGEHLEAAGPVLVLHLPAENRRIDRRPKPRLAGSISRPGSLRAAAHKKPCRRPQNRCRQSDKCPEGPCA